jgi:predicted nucleic acid-binding protein
MSDKVFLDTNIILYLCSSNEPEKQVRAKELFDLHDEIIISTQVINEFINVASRKFGFSWEKLLTTTKDLATICTVQYIDLSIIENAMLVASRFRYSYYDSLMIAAATASKATILYSEDLQHDHSVRQQLKIINPFKSSFAVA